MANRPFDIYDKQSAIIMLTNLLRYVKDLPVTTPCRDCKFYRDPTFCLNAQSDIPLEVLGKGCEGFDLDIDKAPF